MRATRLFIAGMLGVLSLAACGGDGGGTATGPAPTSPAPTSPAPTTVAAPNVEAGGTFSPPPGDVVTYDEALVPSGATGKVTARESDGATTVTLEVSGFQPNRTYGAHAHINPCGAEGKDAGPHFQFKPDPVTPSTDPAYANPQNEIWLDLTTDAEGAGSSTSTVDWEFPADRRAASVIVHAMPTATEPGKAGTAGDRAACMTVDF
jgi:Cu-Zn family superoxide dismutase